MATAEQPLTIVSLTESAATKIRDLMAEEPAGEAAVLRIAVQGGGCSGFQYALGFDRGPRTATTSSTATACRWSSTRSARRT